ncbi:MFS transporter [Streptomyces aculeolatus]
MSGDEGAVESGGVRTEPVVADQAVAEPAAGLSRGRRWAALAVLSASLLVIAMDVTILNVALPHITADLAPSAAQQLWIVDVYALILAGLLVPVSALADRYGRKRTLLAGYLLFGGFSLAILAADSAAGVILIRALLGVAGAMIMPTTLSMVRVVFTDPRERATALGVWAATSAVGIAVGPVVGGLLLTHVSWHSAFLINVPLMAAAIVAGLFLLPEYRTAHRPRWDVPGTVAIIAGMVALVWSIKHFAKEGFGAPESWAALGAAVPALGWFVRRNLRRPDPMLDLRLFRRPPLTAGIVAALEETSYELGSVLGVAVLGSIAAAVYRSRLGEGALSALTPGQAGEARESLAGAVEVAERTGSAGLAARAGDAFVDSLALTGLVGFFALLGAAVLTAVLVPRNLDLTKQSH